MKKEDKTSTFFTKVAVHKSLSVLPRQAKEPAI